MFERVEALLLSHQGLLKACHDEVMSIFNFGFKKRWRHFNDFHKIYFEGSPESMSSFLEDLDPQVFTFSNLEALEQQLRPKSKAHKRPKASVSLSAKVEEFKAAREDLVKSWEYLDEITKRFRSKGMPDITAGRFSTSDRFGEVYKDLFEEENIFSYAVEFLLSSFRESCKGILGNLDILIDYSQLDNSNVNEIRGQIKTLNTHFTQAKEIAHNSDLSLNWDGITRVGPSRYDFIAQDLLSGYRFGVIGTSQDKLTFVGETRYPSFLTFLKSIDLSSSPTVPSAVPSTVIYPKDLLKQLSSSSYKKRRLEEAEKPSSQETSQGDEDH